MRFDGRFATIVHVALRYRCAPEVRGPAYSSHPDKSGGFIRVEIDIERA